METVRIVVQQRDRTGKGFSRRLRMQGQLPGVVYGNGANISIAFAEKDLVRIQQAEAGENTLVELVFEGGGTEACQAILRELQIHPLHRSPLHVDFYRVDMTKSITVSVPLHFVNIPQDRFKADNVTVHMLRHELEISCLPGDIPDTLLVDLEALQPGTILKAGEVALPPSMVLLTDSDEPLVTTTDVEGDA